MAKDRPRIVTYPLAARPSVHAAIAAIARLPNPAVLDSADAAPGRGRFTILACDPAHIASWPDGGDPFTGVQRLLAATAVPSITIDTEPLGGFVGGWIGYFGYDAGRWIEPTRWVDPARCDVPLPVARWALYDTAAVHDARTGGWTLVAVDLEPARAARPPAGERLARLADLLASAAEPRLTLLPPLSAPAVNMSRREYLAMIARAKDYIAAGDIFQVNLARRLSFPAREPPAATYLRLRHANPAAYAAFLAWPDAAILSASPELFLQVTDRQVITRPIKGTRPRSPDPVLDAARRVELLASAKDRAELAMIVDLERNDLGRVCEFGSVRVQKGGSGDFELESHPTVHHLVATVAGRLRADAGSIDLLRACFPGGSITGAPKVRAMQIISELEPTQRSVYTGCIGYFSLSGSVMLNIAIRTLIVAAGQLHLYSGGGIVADSVPEDEFAETEAKALGLLRSLGAEPAGTGAPYHPAQEPS